jgi:hypothetical protein
MRWAVILLLLTGTAMAARPDPKALARELMREGKTEELLGHYVPQTPVDKEAHLYQRMSPEERKLHDRHLNELVKRAGMGMISYDDVTRFSKQDAGGDPGVSSDAVIQSRIDRFVPFAVGEEEKKRMNWPRR